jgi:hypothetical protein
LYCKIILKYSGFRYEDSTSKESNSADRSLLRRGDSGEQSLMQQLVNSNKTLPTKQTSRLVKILVSLICNFYIKFDFFFFSFFFLFVAVNIVILCFILVIGHTHLHQVYVLVPVGITTLIFGILTFFIWKQPQNRKTITFQVSFYFFWLQVFF